MWKWSVRNAHFSGAESWSLPGPGSQLGALVLANDFWFFKCLYLHRVKLLTVSAFSKGTYRRYLPFLTLCCSQHAQMIPWCLEHYRVWCQLLFGAVSYSSQMCTVALFTFSVFNDGIGEIFFMLVCLIKKKKKKKFIFFVILLFFLLFCCQLSASGGKISADVLYMSFENIYIVRYDPVHV